jgi:outer membrane protein
MTPLRSTLPWALLAGLVLAGPAQAESSPWTLRLGPAHVRFSTDAEVSVNGARVPGANAEASSNTTLGFELAYAFDPRWTARLLGGIPPTTTQTGTGALAGAGTLGKVTYGPLAATVTWNLLNDGPVRPYLGAGLNYTVVFKSRDGFIANLDVKSAFGTVLQAGLDLPLSERWTLSLDARKIFLKTQADGVLPAMGGAAAHADVRLDPLVVFLSLGTRF